MTSSEVVSVQESIQEKNSGIHPDNSFSEEIINSPQIGRDLEMQSPIINLSGTKSMPNLALTKSGNDFSEHEFKRKGRGISHYGKPEIAFGTRITPRNDKSLERLSTPDIKQSILLSSRFGHSDRIQDRNEGIVGSTDSRKSSAFTRHADDDRTRELEDTCGYE